MPRYFLSDSHPESPHLHIYRTKGSSLATRSQKKKKKRKRDSSLGWRPLKPVRQQHHLPAISPYITNMHSPETVTQC